MNPVKLLVTSSFITLQNLVAVSHAVCTHVGGPKIWGHWALPPWDGGVDDPYKHAPPPHLCHHAKFGHSRSNHTRKICRDVIKTRESETKTRQTAQKHRNRSVKHQASQIYSKVPTV